MVSTLVQDGVTESHALLWVDLTRDATASLTHSFTHAIEMRNIRDATQVFSAIQIHAPVLVCYEFDHFHMAGLDSLVRVRNELPAIPVLVIAGPDSMAIATWALRLRVWDLLVKPIAHDEVHRSITAVVSPSRVCETGAAGGGRHGSPPNSFANVVALRDKRQRTSSAVSYVCANYGTKIKIETVAALCRLSPSQFCRVFREENSKSFGDYLLHYRMQRARERLGLPGSLVKEAAYAVGYNDLSHFSRSFRQVFGISPSAYQDWARSCLMESCSRAHPSVSHAH
jgi:AraC-like DNA-binding protein/ActR/RegA family two-component response regulator